MVCEVCQCDIPAERLAAIPNVRRCVTHSAASRSVGFMSFSHKTAPTLVMVRTDDAESLRRAQRAFKRAR